MAMLREVEHEEEEDQALTRVTDTVVNERTGLVTQQRTVAYQIRREDGGTAIVIGRSVHAARVVRQISYLFKVSYFISFTAGMDSN